MNIGLIGYGKMGKAIENIATARGHHIVLKISSANLYDLTSANLGECDVAIEFTHPGCALQNIRACIDASIPVISGSTGWLKDWNEVKEYVDKKEGSFIYSSNFSIGVNIFFEVNKKLATLMASRTEYDVSITETHHTQKKDAPSGTAITIAEQIIHEISSKGKWVMDGTGNKNELTITSNRMDPAPGTHQVKYCSPIDDIDIVHTAHNRDGFATGAVIAAEFLNGKKGIFTMKDVLNI